jgi:predicted metal-dependent peptidase
MKETVQVDPDAFDYVFYNYGMTLYGNMPLIEPLETKEIRRVEDFVIVIDTSMSCSGDLVKRFLEETYSVLSQSESFFKKVNIHIIQCDDKVRQDVKIENHEGLRAYMEHMELHGMGGTDFRPAFLHVEQMIRAQQFSKLRGLIYFTDGYGIFPTKMPPYDTAFVFMKDNYTDVDVPPWAIKVILDEEQLDFKEWRQ